MSKAISSNKRENEKKKQAKRLEKLKKKENRKTEGSASFEDMIAYVDENGMITSTPPDMNKKEEMDIDSINISTPKKEKVEEDPIQKGRVEHFNQSKGYGFIKSLTGVDKYFFHISNCPENITEGNIVTFELERGARGMNAVNIQVTE